MNIGILLMLGFVAPLATCTDSDGISVVVHPREAIATVGSPTTVDITLRNQSGRPLTIQSAGQFSVIVAAGTCRQSFGPQSFTSLPTAHSSFPATVSSGEALVVSVPVRISSRNYIDGPNAVTLEGTFRDGSRLLSSIPSRLAVRGPDASIVAAHERSLVECTSFENCHSSVEFFQYVSAPEVADRLIEIARQYPFYRPAIEAVFMQGRREDADSLRELVSAQNADSDFIRTLADRLASGSLCPGAFQAEAH